MTEQTSDSYTLRAILVLILLIIVAYSNTFRASWHFDDYPNIVKSGDIRVKNLYPDTLYKAYRELNNGNHRQRPVTWFTFALNWYYGKGNVAGYHAVNLLIHIVSSIFLFLCCKHILSGYVRQKSDGLGLSLLAAFLAAAMWALHPIQTQAVTYVVQRMASLSGMFYIMAFYFFLRAVYQNDTGKVKYGMYGLMGLCFILALGSKPSSVMFPVSAGLFFMLLESPMRQGLRPVNRILVWGGVCVVVGAAAWYFVGDNPLRLLGGYSIRPFTLTERLLTEGRILSFHLMQLFLLKPFSFSLVHNVPISTSLISPPSTLISILFILLLIGLSWHMRKRTPIVAFSIAFFFINHIVESTVLPLELIYEHRNYIPSMFLFLPLSYGLMKYTYSCNKNHHAVLLRYLIPGIVIFSLMGLTIRRNQDWRTEETFWSDAVKKAPGIARPYHNLAHDYYEKIGDYETALELYQTALTKRDLRPDHKTYSYNNIASLYFKMGEYDAALEYVEKALLLSPGYESALYNKCLVLLSTDLLGEAEIVANELTERYQGNVDYIALYGFVLLKKGNYIEAEKQLRTVVDTNPFHLTALMHFGVLNGIMGDYKKAETLITELINYSEKDLVPMLCLLDLYGRVDETNMNRYGIFILSKYPMPALKHAIVILKKDRLAPLLDFESIESFLDRCLSCGDSFNEIN